MALVFLWKASLLLLAKSQVLYGEKSHPVKVQGLGRTLSLGDLYDIRTNEVVPSYSPWHPNQLINGTIERNQTFEKTDMSTGDNMKKKLDKLGISAELKVRWTD